MSMDGRVAQSHPCDRDTGASLHGVCRERMDAQERRTAFGKRIDPETEMTSNYILPGACTVARVTPYRLEQRAATL